MVPSLGRYVRIALAEYVVVLVAAMWLARSQ